MYSGPLEVEVLRRDGTPLAEVTSHGRAYVVAHPEQAFRIRARLHSPWLPGNGAPGRHYVAFCKVDGECVSHSGKMTRTDTSDLDPWEYTFESYVVMGQAARPFTFYSNLVGTSNEARSPTSLVGAVTVHVQEVEMDEESHDSSASPHFSTLEAMKAVVGGTKIGPATITYSSKEYLFGNKILDVAKPEHQAMATYIPDPPVEETCEIVETCVCTTELVSVLPPIAEEVEEAPEAVHVAKPIAEQVPEITSVYQPVVEIVDVFAEATPTIKSPLPPAVEAVADAKASPTIVSLVPPVPDIPTPAKPIKRSRSMSCNALADLAKVASDMKKSEAQIISLEDAVGLRVGKDQVCDLTGHIMTWKRRRMTIIEL